MKSIILLFCLLLFCSIDLFSQTRSNCVEPYTITTNWEVEPPFENDPRYPNYNGFDWTAPKFQFVTRDICTGDANGVTIREYDSPFYDAGSAAFTANTYHLWEGLTDEQKDYRPENGWELYRYDFGKYELDGTGKVNDSKATSYPFIALYNRYTGILRFFYLTRCESDAANGMSILVMFNRTERIDRTKVLSGNSTYSSSHYDYVDTIKTIAFANYQYNSVMWHMGEIQTAYDPCKCNSGHPLKMEFILMETTKLEVNLNVAGSITSVSSINGPPDENGEIPAPLIDNTSIMGLFKSGSNIAQKAISGYKTWQSYKGGVNSFLDKYSYETNAQMTDAYTQVLKFSGLDISNINIFDQLDPLEIRYSIENTPKTKSKYFEAVQGLMGLTSYLPYVGAAYGIFNLFTGGIGNASSPPPSVSQVNLQVTGTIESKDELLPNSIYIPGLNTISNETFTPIYNNTFGVISFLKKPTLKRYRYNSEIAPVEFDNMGNVFEYHVENGKFGGGGRDPLKSFLEVINDSYVNQYALNEPLSVMLNPHSNLELISSEACYVLEFDRTFNYDLRSSNGTFPIQRFIVIPNIPIQNQKFSHRSQQAGWYLENSTPNIEGDQSLSNFENIQMRTKYVPMNVFHKESFYLSKYATGLPNYQSNNAPKAFIKVTRCAV